MRPGPADITLCGQSFRCAGACSTAGSPVRLRVDGRWMFGGVRRTAARTRTPPPEPAPDVGHRRTHLVRDVADHRPPQFLDLAPPPGHVVERGRRTGDLITPGDLDSRRVVAVPHSAGRRGQRPQRAHQAGADRRRRPDRDQQHERGHRDDPALVCRREVEPGRGRRTRRGHEQQCGRRDKGGQLFPAGSGQAVGDDAAAAPGSRRDLTSGVRKTGEAPSAPRGAADSLARLEGRGEEGYAFRDGAFGEGGVAEDQAAGAAGAQAVRGDAVQAHATRGGGCHDLGLVEVRR
jgi:hypothetical protein